MDQKEIGWDGVVRMNPIQVRNMWWALVNTAMNRGVS